MQVVLEAMPERLQFSEMVEDAMANPANCKQRKVQACMCGAACLSAPIALP